MDELIISPSTSSQEKCVELLNILSLEECLKSSDLVKKLKDEAFVKAEESDFCRLVLDETKKKLRSEMIEIGPALKQLDTLEAELVLLSQRIDLEGQAKLIRSMLQKRVTSIGRLKLFRDLLGDLIQIITLVDEIKSESIIAPRNALDLYRKLRNLSLDEGKNKQARPTTAYEFLHRYLEKCKAEAISVMREKFTSELFKSLSKIGWPKSMYAKGFEKGLKGSDLELWVSMLLKLEKLEGEKKKLRFYKDMLQEVTDEFKYHFCGPRQTSRLDRPEWAFEWVLKFVQTQLPFFQDFLQYVHDKNSYRNIDSVNQMVSVFLEVLESKIAADKAALLESPENIIRYVKETANFEDSLIRYNIIPDIVSEADEFQKYRLVDALVCDDQIFTALINYMKSSSIETLKRMFTSNIALALVYDAVIELDSTKITQSADMLISILEYVKNFHKSLPNIDHRLVFVKDIELMILKKYITYVLDAFRKIYDSHPLRPDLMCRCATSIYTAGLIIKEISNSEVRR